MRSVHWVDFFFIIIWNNTFRKCSMKLPSCSVTIKKQMAFAQTHLSRVIIYQEMYLGESVSM